MTLALQLCTDLILDVHVKYEAAVIGTDGIELIDDNVQLIIRRNLGHPLPRCLICLAAIVEALGLIFIEQLVVEYAFLTIISIIVFDHLLEQ